MSQAIEQEPDATRRNQTYHVTVTAQETAQVTAQEMRRGVQHNEIAAS